MVKGSKSFNESTIDLYNLVIIEDQFDDGSQNANIYDGAVSGNPELMSLLRHCDISTIRVLNVGSGGQKLADNVVNLEPCTKRSDASTITGWCENIVTNEKFDLIVCWGVLCFVRSVPETLIEFNKCLEVGGKLVMDVISYTVMPFAQTSEPESFVRYCQLYGFVLEEVIDFGHSSHVRHGLRLRKKFDFDYRRLQIPQCSGKINNFLFERDWYLR